MVAITLLTTHGKKGSLVIFGIRALDFTDLKTKDNRPDQTKSQSGVPRVNVLTPDVLQPDSFLFQVIQYLVQVLEALEFHARIL